MDNIALLVQQRISQDIEIVVEIVVEQSNLKMHIKYVCGNNKDYIWNCTEQKNKFWNCHLLKFQMSSFKCGKFK